MTTTTQVIQPGNFHLVDTPRHNNRLVSRGETVTAIDGDYIYRDVVSGTRYTRSQVSNIRSIAILTVPTITGTQDIGTAKLYNTSNGTVFKPANPHAIDEQIEAASAAIAVRQYELARDSNWQLKSELRGALDTKGAKNIPTDLVRKAIAAGLLKL